MATVPGARTTACTSCTTDADVYYSDTVTTCAAIQQIIAEAQCASVITDPLITWAQAQGGCYMLDLLCPTDASVLIQTASGPILLSMADYDSGLFQFICEAGEYFFNSPDAGTSSQLQSVVCFDSGAGDDVPQMEAPMTTTDTIATTTDLIEEED
ncbi:unnamed protein product, partial [Mesorhabditis spiculigera]